MEYAGIVYKKTKNSVLLAKQWMVCVSESVFELDSITIFQHSTQNTALFFHAI